MDELINGVMQSVVGKWVDRQVGFWTIQLRFYHELPRMKVILKDNATTWKVF